MKVGQVACVCAEHIDLLVYTFVIKRILYLNKYVTIWNHKWVFLMVEKECNK